jgi:amino acid adenylation domain-containing protein
MLAAAKLVPDTPAVLEPAADGGWQAVSYRQLEEQTDCYVAALDELGLDVGDRVIIQSQTCANAIAALAACATLGLPFIPVSPDTPDKRLLAIAEIAEPALFLQGADGDREDLPPQLGTARFGPGGLTVERPPVARVRHRRGVVSTDPAYLVFTSGTTGRPKGVVMSHRANLAFYRGMQAEGVMSAADRVAIASPFHFDLCLGGIGLTLGCGATVIPIPRDRLDWPRRFVAFLQDTGATQVQGVPSIWRMLLRHDQELLAGLDQLESVLFSGEDFPLPELRQLRGWLPGRRIMNCYGATESMAASVTDVPERIPDDLDLLPIGQAHPGAEMTIHDEAGRPIEQPGVAGEIYLRSPALFSGYWNDQAATRAALVPDPLIPASGQLVLRTGDLAYRGEAGELYFCGRTDSQVQIRGNRVELGEVERRLLEYPGVAAAIAMLPPVRFGEAELSAFVIVKPDTPAIGIVELRAFCMETLPAYMAPRNLHTLTEFPVTANGKIDRTALAAAFNE